MLTRANIAYDLHISPHKYTMLYEGQEVTYFFSSELYKKKFIERLQANREGINSSLSKRFNMAVQCDLLADFRLYTTIEKRGFLVSVNGDYVECQKSIVLDGTRVIPKS